MKSLRDSWLIHVRKKAYRPRIIALAILVAMAIAVVAPIQHYLDRFLLPILLHQVPNKFLAAMILTPLIFGGWYLVLNGLIRLAATKWGHKPMPRWLVRLTFVEVRPREKPNWHSPA